MTRGQEDSYIYCVDKHLRRINNLMKLETKDNRGSKWIYINI